MVRLLTIVAMLFAGASSVAASYCQCLYPDGSHCCVINNEANDCKRMCMRASGDHTTAGECRANGKFSNVSGWNALHRTQCEPPFIY
ncbi:hypothetical protein GGP41_002723 [Bipolaris sorokiniana]|uniref:Extracellular membrane protein CFEM domain-containing protein n=2 Tax=Cochliobolus sativus TaxID=45130 RepID=A0A8H6DWK6_COCSA|nr:uncharacterized protein COCSADRAFT_37675 [Bipolaris sorokiniana ND90Pr]EMD63957.1 hypothetical protein COCSADRAFT_37675 [Bipolaris sorokiniana ND90Pr]KAF5850529.1 hypothetical protein GGP41_002723 [Bipolaris sorokiniana]